MRRIHKNRGTSTVPATAAKAKRVVIDFPETLYCEAEVAAVELHINRSSLIREAVAQFLDELRRRKLEIELEEGYRANAASARLIAEEMAGAEADFA